MAPQRRHSQNQQLASTPTSTAAVTSSRSSMNNGRRKEHYSSASVSSSSSLPCRDFFFLTDEAANALPHYVYEGEDLSLLYKYVLSPLAAFLVNRCTPHTTAPNTITLLGLSFMVTSYCIEWYYCPTFQTTAQAMTMIPSWIFFVNGCAMLIYQTLDNMDGKQARRTGSSSPLGLLFDHGCDAANSMFGSANWIIAIGLSTQTDALACWVLVLGPMALFYIATWEEYYTGRLILPIMNGPNEGLVLGALTSFTTAMYGISYWQETTWYDNIVEPYVLPMVLPYLPTIANNMRLRNCDIQIAMASFGFVQETCSKMVLVAYRHGVKSLLALLPFVTLCVCTLVVGMYDRNADIWTQMPRTSLHLISGLFVEMCAQLMLDHITKQRFQPFRWILLPLVLMTLAVVVCNFVNATAAAAPPAAGVAAAATTLIANANDFLWIYTRAVGAAPPPPAAVVAAATTLIENANDFLLVYTTAVWTFLLFKMTLVIHEVCTTLDIWCFDIVTPRRPRPQWQKAE